MHIAVDFDGTICNYEPGDRQKEIYRDMLFGFTAFLRWALDAGHEVTVFTACAEKPEYTERIKKYILEKTGERLEVTNIKNPKFDLIIDDKALRFDEPYMNWPIILALVSKYKEGLNPWWKVEPLTPVTSDVNPASGCQDGTESSKQS